MARAGDGKPRSDKRHRSKQISKRLTEDEFLNFRKAAKAKGFDSHQAYLSAFLRGHIELQRQEQVRLTRFVGHLGRIGNNINQIARAANSGKLKLTTTDAQTLADMRAVLEEISTQIRRFGW